MANVSLWSNVQIAVQSALGANKTITGITKANPAVVTSTAHGLSNGAYVRLSVLGMNQINDRVVRVANVTTNTFECEGVDSTAFDTFVSGTANEITFGTTLSTVTDIQVSGGDFEFEDTTTIHDTEKSQIPVASSPITINMGSIWDPSDAGLVALKSASDSRAKRAMRITFSNGYKWLFNGYAGVTLAPTGNAQQKAVTPMVFTVNGRTTTYTT